MMWFRGLLWVVAAVLIGAGAVQAQDLKDPDLLARYDQLASDGPDAEGVLENFEAFAADYLELALSDEAPCLFGCNSGFSGNSPDYSGSEFREFMARSDLVLLARTLGMSTVALTHLERATSLLETQWNLHLTIKSSSESGSRKLNVLMYFGWTSYHGCSASFPEPAALAKPLLYDIDQLRLQTSISPALSKRMDYISGKLQGMSARDD